MDIENVEIQEHLIGPQLWRHNLDNSLTFQHLAVDPLRCLREKDNLQIVGDFWRFSIPNIAEENVDIVNHIFL